jgi:hypothetical protein
VADLALLLLTLCWGTTFLLVKGRWPARRPACS